MPEPACPESVRVDFAACWNVEGARRYVYRVPCLQLLLVECGGLTARADGRWWKAGPGEMLCLGREPRNEYGWDVPTVYWETHLTIPAPLVIDGGSLPPLVALKAGYPAVRAAMEHLCLELDRPGDTHRLHVQASAWQILAAIATALAREPATPRTDPWQAVRDRLDRAFDRPLSVADLARDMDLTEDGFIRAFRRRHGVGPMAWRAQAKMRQACRLLAHAPVKEVAARLGFTDASAFARSFRRHIGIPPSEYAIAGPALPAGTADTARPYPLNRHVRPADTSDDFAWR